MTLHFVVFQYPIDVDTTQNEITFRITVGNHKFEIKCNDSANHLKKVEMKWKELTNSKKGDFSTYMLNEWKFSDFHYTLKRLANIARRQTGNNWIVV